MKGGKMFVWRWPVTIGIVTLAGLFSALMGDGVWDWISAVLLAIPAGLCIFYGFGKRAGAAGARRKARAGNR